MWLNIFYSPYIKQRVRLYRIIIRDLESSKIENNKGTTKCCTNIYEDTFQSDRGLSQEDFLASLQNNLGHKVYSQWARIVTKDKI